MTIRLSRTRMLIAFIVLGQVRCALGQAGISRSAPLVREVRFLSLRPDERPSIVIPRTSGPVSVEGKLDEAAWKSAAVLDRFLFYPIGTADPRRTPVLLMYDAQNLYVGMTMYGDDTDQLKLVEQSSPDVWGGHMVEIWLAPSTKPDDFHHLCLNAKGSRYDETLKQGPSWQGAWVGKGAVEADHWTVEIAFPFKDVGLAGPPTGRPWSVNFARIGERDASWTGAWENTERFGLMFFGSDEAYRSGMMPGVEMLLDREEYDPLDVTGVALLKVQRGSEPLSKLKVRIEVVSEGGRVVQHSEVAPLEKEALDVTLNTGAIPNGTYLVRAILLDEKDKLLASAERPLRKLVRRRQLSEPIRGKVIFRVWRADRNQSDPWPITTGLPFPQGALTSGDHVRLLDERGHEVPCQTVVRSQWNRHGSVRWLGLDFQGLLTQKGATYTLEFGQQVPGSRGEALSPTGKGLPLNVSENRDVVRVRTGPLKFIVRKRGFNLLDEVRLRGEVVARQDAGCGLELTDHEGAVYRAANDPDTRVTVEERGPLKVVLRVEGWYVKDGTRGARLSPALPTDRLCQHITRITAYAGKPYVHVQHVLVVTFDTHKVRLRNAAVGIGVPGLKKAAFSMDGQAQATPTPLPASVRLYQPSSERALIETDGEREGEYRNLLAGKRGDGWFRALGTKGGVTMAVQDLWQLYPKELEISKGRMRLHIWPLHGRSSTGVNSLAPEEIYKLWWCHQGRELDFRMPDDVFKTLTESDFGKAAGCKENFINGRVANAQGVAAETNSLLWFHPAGASVEQAREINANFQWQPHAYADPQWVCDSLVFGPMTPREETRFPDPERYFEHNVMLRVAAQEYARDYGMWNFLDFHSDNSGFTNGRWGLNRVWNNGHHGTARLPWYLYVRSGDPHYLQLARRVARHVMNVDVVHYVTPDYDLFADCKRPSWPNLDHTRGAMYHVKGFQHWGGDNVVAGHPINYDFMLWDYYLNGNHRALEVAKEWAEGIKQLAPHGYSDREGTMTLAELTEMYQATWDVGLLDILDAFQRRIAATPFAEQQWPNYAPFLERYLSFTGSEAYRKRALEWKDRSPNVVAALYYETKDPARLREALPLVALDSLRYDSDDRTITPGRTIPPWYNISYQVQYWQPYLRALRDAGIEMTLSPQAEQWMPQGATLYVCKDKPGALPLRFNWFARAKEPIEVSVVGPDGKDRLAKQLNQRDRPEGPVTETIPDDGTTGLFRVNVNLRDYRYGLRAPISDLPTLAVIPAGGVARFFGPQVWYFRTGKDETTVNLEIPALGREGSVHLRTADGRRSLTSRGQPGTLTADVQPNTIYAFAAIQTGSNANVVVPKGRRLVLAMKPEHLFDLPTK